MRLKIGVFLIVIGIVGAVIFLGKAAETNEKNVYLYSKIFIGSIITFLVGLGIATFPRIRIK